MCTHWAASTLHIDHIMAFIHTTQASWRKCVNVCVFFGITTCIYFIVLCIVCMLYGIHICTIHTIRKKNTLLRFVHSGTNEKENVNRARTLTIIWTEHTLFLPVFAALIILLWLLLLTDDRPRVNFIFFFFSKKKESDFCTAFFALLFERLLSIKLWLLITISVCARMTLCLTFSHYKKFIASSLHIFARCLLLCAVILLLLLFLFLDSIFTLLLFFARLLLDNCFIYISMCNSLTSLCCQCATVKVLYANSRFLLATYFR